MRVLIVDDEADVANFLGRLIERLGHTVRVVNDGIAALEAVRSGGFQLMISDIRMPGMDGVQLYDAIVEQKLGSGLSLVFTTGDAINPSTQEFFERTQVRCLDKPFTAEQVRQLLQSIPAA